MKLKGFIHIALVTVLIAFSSCSDDQSYAHLLELEDQAVNNFLADNTVVQEIPADTIFETGANAPFYRLDEDGQLYMQVLDAGTPDNKVKNNDQIYFRYTRYALSNYHDGYLPQGAGNNLTLIACWFRYNNYNIQGSYQWGTGIQAPLRFLPIDCKVRLVVKSQQGFIDEQTSVVPFLYDLTYHKDVN